MIIGITGTLAAGKGTVVDYLKEMGFLHYSVSGYLEELLKEMEKPANRDNLVWLANKLREENSPSYLAEKLYEIAKKSNANCIIESLRTPGEIDALRKKEEFYLISVDANQDIRYFRAIERKSEKDSIDFETFKLNEEREMTSQDPTKQNLKKCIEMSDFKILNNGTPEELKKQVDFIVEKIKTKNKNLQRKEYISWDEYFMGVALLSAQRSKDPSTQVGACIVDEDKRIVGTGYNGAPKGFSDEEFPWERKGDFLNTKYAYVCHAELNAILNSTKESLKNCTIYVALFPCNECAKAIIQSGIKKVVYLSDKYKETESSIAARRMFGFAGIELVELKTKIDAIKLNFDREKW